MKIFNLILLCCIGLLMSCSKDQEPKIINNNNSDDDDQVTELNGDLILTVLDEFVADPAKVSIFFKVDTKDGKPVAGLEPDDFTIYEKGRNDDKENEISKDEAERHIATKEQVFSYSTMLVLDLSGSVINDKLETLKTASKQFIDQVMPNSIDSSLKMTIRWFDGEDVLHELVPWTPNKTQLQSAIDGINKDLSQDKSTDLYGAVLKSVSEAGRIQQQIGDDVLSAVSVVLFTDGTDQAARYGKQEALDAVANADARISFYTIGLGDEIDETVLMKIGKNSAAFADNTEQLVEKFDEIANTVSSAANSYYLFEYCSPKRSGTSNELRVVVQKGNAQGDFKTTFDATGFKGGCSL